MTDDEWHRVLRVNLDGVFLHVPDSDATHGGAAVTAARSSSPRRARSSEGQARGQNYGASKGGVVSMMRAIAVEHARHGIRANAIVPGWIETAMTEPAFGWDRSWRRCCRASRNGDGERPTTSAASPSIWPARRPPTTRAT